MKKPQQETRIIRVQLKRCGKFNSSKIAIYSDDLKGSIYYGVPLDWFFELRNGDRFKVTVERLPKD